MVKDFKIMDRVRLTNMGVVEIGERSGDDEVPTGIGDVTAVSESKITVEFDDAVIECYPEWLQLVRVS
jgi:hypothetical protein